MILFNLNILFTFYLIISGLFASGLFASGLFASGLFARGLTNRKYISRIFRSFAIKYSEICYFSTPIQD